MWQVFVSSVSDMLYGQVYISRVVVEGESLKPLQLSDPLFLLVFVIELQPLVQPIALPPSTQTSNVRHELSFRDEFCHIGVNYLLNLGWKT